MYKKDDKVVFRVGEESFEYTVKKGRHDIWFLITLTNSNLIIFRKLHIVDRFEFVRSISKYVTDDISVSFPEIAYPDETEINKVIDALLKKCNEYNKQFNDTTTCYKNGDEEKMKESLKTEENVSTETTSQKPIFKEGDYVRVIFREDVKDSNCYRFGFVKEMLKYCGNIYIVHQVSNSHSEAESEPDDGMLYRLKTTDGDVLRYSFASSMLIGTPIVPPQLPFLDKLQLKYPLQFSDSFVPSDCVSKIINSETKTVLKKSTSEYKLKFTN